jgi:hypothetical protein
LTDPAMCTTTPAQHLSLLKGIRKRREDTINPVATATPARADSAIMTMAAKKEAIPREGALVSAVVAEERTAEAGINQSSE